LATLSDRLFTEVDRQLPEVRTYTDAVATRAGLLISANALAASLLGSRISTKDAGAMAITAIAAFGLSALFGLFVFAPSLISGPNVSSLATWAGAVGAGPTADANKDLYGSKLVALEANLNRLTIMRVMFYLQGLAVIVAVTSALIVAGQVEGP
jgi:hypothetical protein